MPWVCYHSDTWYWCSLSFRSWCDLIAWTLLSNACAVIYITQMAVEFFPPPFHSINRALKLTWLKILLSVIVSITDLPENHNYLHQGIHQSVFMSAMAPNPNKDLSLCWEQHSKLLPGVDKINGSDVSGWSIEKVASFIKTLPGCEEQAKTFKDEVTYENTSLGSCVILIDKSHCVVLVNECSFSVMWLVAL